MNQLNFNEEHIRVLIVPARKILTQSFSHSALIYCIHFDFFLIAKQYVELPKLVYVVQEDSLKCSLRFVKVIKNEYLPSLVSFKRSNAMHIENLSKIKLIARIT